MEVKPFLSHHLPSLSIGEMISFISLKSFYPFASTILTKQVSEIESQCHV